MQQGLYLCQELLQRLCEQLGLLLNKLLTGWLQVAVYIFFRIKVMFSYLGSTLKKKTTISFCFCVPRNYQTCKECHFSPTTKKQTPSHLQQELYQGIVAIQPKKSWNSHRIQDFKCCICETKLLIQWTCTVLTEKLCNYFGVWTYTRSLSPQSKGAFNSKSPPWVGEVSACDGYSTHTHIIIF